MEWTDRDWQNLYLMTKIQVVGALIGIPVGFLLVRKWPEQTLLTAGALTILGLGVKHWLMKHHEAQLGAIEALQVLEEIPAEPPMVQAPSTAPL